MLAENKSNALLVFPKVFSVGPDHYDTLLGGGGRKSFCNQISFGMLSTAHLLLGGPCHLVG